MLSFVKDRKKNAAPGSEANLFMDQGQEFTDFSVSTKKSVDIWTY